MHDSREGGGRAASGTAAEEVEQRMEHLPTTAWMQEVGQSREHLPRRVGDRQASPWMGEVERCREQAPRWREDEPRRSSCRDEGQAVCIFILLDAPRKSV